MPAMTNHNPNNDAALIADLSRGLERVKLNNGLEIAHGFAESAVFLLWRIENDLIRASLYLSHRYLKEMATALAQLVQQYAEANGSHSDEEQIIHIGDQHVIRYRGQYIMILNMHLGQIVGLIRLSVDELQALTDQITQIVSTYPAKE